MATRDPGSTRERIVEHARDLYVEGGMAALSMRKVADRVGVSATALYRHFDRKETLLMEVCRTGFERFTSYLLRGLAGSTPRERLRLSGEGYVRFALDNPAYYRIMFMASRDDFGFAELPAQSSETMTRSFHLLVDRVRECQDAGLLRAGDPAELAVLIWSASHGLVSLYLCGQLGPLQGDDEGFVRFFLRARSQQLEGLAG
jgi:AcrR family transcriptional regulator